MSVSIGIVLVQSCTLRNTGFVNCDNKNTCDPNNTFLSTFNNCDNVKQCLRGTTDQKRGADVHESSLGRLDNAKDGYPMSFYVKARNFLRTSMQSYR